MEETKTLTTAQPQTGLISVAASREAQEIQAAMVVAQRCPRDQTRAFNAIIEACKRKSLAEKACYSYPRGGQEVTGPSIRLAETMAQNWGNLQFGIQELENKVGSPGVPGESIMRAYCWDMETNVRREMTFTVRHIRDKKGGGVKLDSERDIYELVANQGARRVRACILAVIPGDVVEAAVEQCDQTLRGGKEPLVDRIRAMVGKFAEIGVTQEMIEKRIGHKLEAVNETELVSLGKVWNSIRDGYADRSQYFDFGGGAHAAEPAQAAPPLQAEDLSRKVKEPAQPPPKQVYNHAPGASNPPPKEPVQEAPKDSGSPAGDCPTLPPRKEIGAGLTGLFKKLGMPNKEAIDWTLKQTGGQTYNSLTDVEAFHLLEDLQTYAIEKGIQP